MVVRGQRRRQRHELPELVVGGRHAREGRAAEGAQGGALLLAVAEDEGEAGDAALVFFFFFFFFSQDQEREEKVSWRRREENRAATAISPVPLLSASLSLSLFLSLVVSLPCLRCGLLFGGKVEVAKRKKEREKEVQRENKVADSESFGRGSSNRAFFCSFFPRPNAPFQRSLFFSLCSPQGSVAGPPLAPSVSKQTQQSGVVVPTRLIDVFFFDAQGCFVVVVSFRATLSRAHSGP